MNANAGQHETHTAKRNIDDSGAPTTNKSFDMFACFHLPARNVTASATKTTKRHTSISKRNLENGVNYPRLDLFLCTVVVPSHRVNAPSKVTPLLQSSRHCSYDIHPEFGGLVRNLQT